MSAAPTTPTATELVNERNAERWIADQSNPLFTLSVTDAFEIGRRWTEDRYRDALATHLSEGRA